MMAFVAGAQFNSFEEFKLAKEAFEIENNASFVVKNSELLNASEKYSAQDVLNLKYKRIAYECKFGGVARPRGTGIRQTATFKKNCPAKINVNTVVENERCFIIITNLVSDHQYHKCDSTEFGLLPSQRRKVIEKNADYVKEVLAVDGDKKLIQNQLNERNENVVIVTKDIHNFEARLSTKRCQSVDDFISELSNMPESNISIFVNGTSIEDHDNAVDLESICFQDERMLKNFELYPELLICDATYKVNDRNMPLFVMMVVDGHGETQIAALVLLKSENNVAMRSALTAFKNTNPKHTETKVSDISLFTVKSFDCSFYHLSTET